MEAVQRWRKEKESRLSGDKQEEEEEESIYSVRNDQVNYSFTCSTVNQSAVRGVSVVMVTCFAEMVYQQSARGLLVHVRVGIRSLIEKL